MRQSDSPSSGPGGQKINKTSSAVQLIHAPTGVVVKCQETRSRSQNRVIARNLLANKLEVLDKGPLSRQGQLIAKKVAQKKSATKKSRRKHAKGGVEGSYNNPDEGEFLDDNGVWVSGVVTEADLKGAVELKGLSKMKIISPKATSNKPWDFERPGIFTTRVHRGVPEGVGIEACGGEEGALVMYRGHSGAEMDETGEFIEGIDEDEYDDEESEEEDDRKPATPPSLKHSSAMRTTLSPSTKGPMAAEANVVVTREKLEADRKAAEEAAKRAFHTEFFTLETDRDAMLEQQKLDESDRQVNAEANAAQDTQPGKLSSANLGASSLTLKHLIARIDATRERVKISDMELRNLMSEVRKNRSKWASEDKVGQEELYEAAEKVVLELRAMTEHSTAFLNRVNKREAPDYYQSERYPTRDDT